MHAFLAEHRCAVFPDEMFEDLFPTGRGRPSVPADVIATVMVLQALEGLSDRQAVRRLETDIAWKAAAGLALTDEAFHSTVLVLWRNKLWASDRPQRIFDAIRAVITASGVIATKTRRALDSTVLDDAVARQDTIAGPVDTGLAQQSPSRMPDCTQGGIGHGQTITVNSRSRRPPILCGSVIGELDFSRTHQRRCSRISSPCNRRVWAGWRGGGLNRWHTP